ncbi:hypothetical protein [Pseudomonas massiliensis]|uniref:hypothetical protein n=1 Tax=Pseudomonas massiliensis TaxID=522492 RepID=UPI0005915F10|nr:hypothetical protein [Pseudomonas massiliensis]
MKQKLSPPSRDALVAWMKTHDMMLGWNAVIAYDRLMVNRLLRQQWLEKYDNGERLPPAKGRFEEQAPGEYRWLGGVSYDRVPGSGVTEPAESAQGRKRRVIVVLG